MLNEIGESAFPDVFLLAASSKLQSEIKPQFSAKEVRDRSAYPWVTQTLLYFLGVLTYAEEAEGAESDEIFKNLNSVGSARFLTIPNKTMQYLVCFTITSQLRGLTNIIDH